MAVHRGNNIMFCKICGAGFNHKQTMTKHVCKGHPKSCDLCRKQFRSNEEIRQHMAEHNGESMQQTPSDSPDQEDRLNLSDRQWSREEKWILIWAVELSKLRMDLKRKGKTQLWSSIFYTHCIEKKDIPRTILRTRKFTFLKQNTFTQQELLYMRTQIKQYIDNKVCPMEQPIPLPEFSPPSPHSPDAAL